MLTSGCYTTNPTECLLSVEHPPNVYRLSLDGPVALDRSVAIIPQWMVLNLILFGAMKGKVCNNLLHCYGDHGGSLFCTGIEFISTEIELDTQDLSSFLQELSCF